MALRNDEGMCREGNHTALIDKGREKGMEEAFSVIEMIFAGAVLLASGIFILYMLYYLICMSMSRKGMKAYLKKLEAKAIEKESEDVRRSDE